jgi:Mce-associated membrane protein
MPPRQPARKGRTRLGPSDADATARRLLAARSRQARSSQARSSAPVEPGPAAEAEAVAEASPAAEPVVEPIATEGAASEPVGSEEVGEDAGPRGRLPRPVLVLAALTVVFGCLAAWFGAEAGSANSGTDTQNTALTNASATSVVSGQIASEVGTLFSYNYISPQPTVAAASHDLTGAAVSQYAALFGRVRQLAPQDQLIVTTSVTNVGVEMLNGSTARVLVFARESDRRANQAAGTPVTAMLAVNATLAGGQWKISGIDANG